MAFLGAFPRPGGGAFPGPPRPTPHQRTQPTMTSLLDIGDQSRTVSIAGQPIEVFGITPEGFFYLLDRFPILQKLFTTGRQELTFADVREQAPGCVAYAIAVATTDRETFNKEASDDGGAAFLASQRESTKSWKVHLDKVAAKARKLSTPQQMALFDAAITLTFPDGVGPFMSAMDNLANSINRISGQADQDTTSSNRSPTGFVTDSPGIRLGKGVPLRSSRH